VDRLVGCALRNQTRNEEPGGGDRGDHGYRYRHDHTQCEAVSKLRVQDGLNVAFCVAVSGTASNPPQSHRIFVGRLVSWTAAASARSWIGRAIPSPTTRRAPSREHGLLPARIPDGYIIQKAVSQGRGRRGSVSFKLRSYRRRALKARIASRLSPTATQAYAVR
jgi:hypothetical protein